VVDINLSDELVMGARRKLTLPSGRVAAIRTGKGRDLMHAHRAVQGNSDPTAIVFALVATLCEVEGKPVTYEEVLEMDLQDVLALQSEVMGANFQSPPPPGSPASSSSASRPAR